MEVKQVKIKDITPYENNAKIHPDNQIDQIAKSLEMFGWQQPMVISKDGVIVIGHGRYEAAKKLGQKEVPCVIAEDLTDDELRMLRLADNKLNESPWDMDILAEELEGLDFGDLDLDWGLDDDPEPIEVTEDNYDVELPPEPKSQIGDIYQLGRHRLMCGDSTSPEDVAKLMNGDGGAILLTSPPYSDLREYGDHVDTSIDTLKLFIDAFEPYTNIQVVNLGLKFKDNEVVQYWDNYIAEAKGCGYKLMAWNVWNKGHSGSVGSQTMFFPLIHEWIMVFAKERIELNRTVAKNPENIKAKPELRSTRQPDGSTKTTTTGDLSHRFKKMGSVSNIEPEHNNAGILKSHPARFPVELPAEYIKAMTDEDENVIDCFGGSGTTLIACEQLHRNCYMMEMEPQYIDLIIDRWETFTGEKAVKLNV